MSRSIFEMTARGLQGFTHENLVIGTTTHALVVALAQEDVQTQNDNTQIRYPFYTLRLPFDAAVAVGEEATIPVSDAQQFTGEITEIDPDPLRDCQWCILRGDFEAVS